MPVKSTKPIKVVKKPNKHNSEENSDPSDSESNSKIIPNNKKKPNKKSKPKPIRRTNGKKQISFKMGIYKILQNLNQGRDIRISKKAIQIFDDMAIDLVETLSRECGELCQFSGKATLVAHDVDAAVKLMTKEGFLQDAILQYKEKKTCLVLQYRNERLAPKSAPLRTYTDSGRCYGLLVTRARTWASLIHDLTHFAIWMHG